MKQALRILVASRDPALEDVRRKALEASGYTVISVRTPSEVESICNAHHISLVIIGYSVEPVVKRQIWEAVKRDCFDSRPPILELHHSGAPMLTDSHTHHSVTPADFLDAVDSILKRA